MLGYGLWQRYFAGNSNVIGQTLTALLLAAIGLYGVVAFTVTQRQREIAIRIALGAQKSDVLTLILAQGMKLALTGTALGLVAASAFTRLIRSLLYGVAPIDPLTFTAVSALLVATALLACWVPARRAAKLDPLEALHCE